VLGLAALNGLSSFIEIDEMENLFGFRFHHLGLAAQTPDPAKSFLLALGYHVGETIFDPLQNVRLTMCEHRSMPAVEIVSRGDGKGPLDYLLSRHSDGLIYHMCYSTGDLERALQALVEAGLRVHCVSPPKPAILFAGKRVSFYQIIGMGLIEIIDERE
jgi:methylmalonyl-CoA/ethylmalonyl-CoA epimerase